MSVNIATQNIPAGFVQDARGRLVHESNVKEIDKLRDQTIAKIVDLAKDLSGALHAGKISMTDDVLTFADISLDRYNQKLGGEKGNISLMRFDGLQKVVLQCPDVISFGEGLLAAKKLIDECLASWTAGASGQNELRSVIDGAFSANKQGNIDAQRVLSLRRYNIQDERWQLAMQAISEAIVVTGKRSYVRAYERDTQDGKWRAIPLDIAAL